MKVHFIAIGGSAMHNLAIALHKKGYEVTGSDDEIVEPSRSRLKEYGLLPDASGWFPDKITKGLDAIILGMHARKDNPELLKAQELGIKILSYPEYFYEQTKDKKRAVIGGSHGKTTITSMIMHVLKECGWAFDYLVGSQVPGFDTMVGLSNNAEVAIIEGDEYPASPIDPRPKFHIYKPHIAVISGIAWDHLNVFPTFEVYLKQFEIFSQHIEPGGSLIYFKRDKNITGILSEADKSVTRIPYDTHPNKKGRESLYLITEDKEKIPITLFGEHNLQNINAARLVCNELGVSKKDFYNAIDVFTGAKKRLEMLRENENSICFLDFAHSPSKLQATIKAVKDQYPHRKLIACMELHTYSSLKKEFLPQYKNTMQDADVAYVFFNPRTIAHKQLEMIDKELVWQAFGGQANLEVFTDNSTLLARLKSHEINNTNLLIMSSGNFSGIDFQVLANEMIP